MRKKLIFILWVFLFSIKAFANPANVPCYLQHIIANANPSSSDNKIAENNILVLDTELHNLDDRLLKSSKAHLLKRFPVVVSFDTKYGGEMYFYRPGQPPLHADPVPLPYQINMSVAHSPMAVYEILAPYILDPSADSSWVAPLNSFKTKIENAISTLNNLKIPDDNRSLLRFILKYDMSFIDKCLEKDTYSFDELEKFAQDIVPKIKDLYSISASIQVKHWELVVESWKRLAANDWMKTYAITSTTVSKRQNNILYTILYQYFGKMAIKDRLILVETLQEITFPDDILNALVKILNDRALGKLFFKDYYLMDADLLGDFARKVIMDEASKKGQQYILPPLAPFNSHQFPWATDKTSGPGPATFEEALKENQALPPSWLPPCPLGKDEG